LADNRDQRSRILVEEEVYAPSDDSFLLEENIIIGRGGYVLDMGTGTGIQAIKAAQLGGRRIIAIDINPHASRCASENVRLNGLQTWVSIITSDLFKSLRKGVLFDTILFNPPYLRTRASEYEKGWLEKAWAGGRGGRETIDRFLVDLPGHLKEEGKVFIVHPSRGASTTIRKLRRLGLKVETTATKKIFFDQLLILSAAYTKTRSAAGARQRSTM
jgi:release factor glutamine methyltransferase